MERSSALSSKSTIPHTLTSIALGVMLSACISSAAWSADEEDFFAFSQKGEALRSVPLNDVFGSNPKTVFVPGRLFRNGQGALFVNGQRFVAPNGARDVAGFIDDHGKYLVAVRANVVSFSENVGAPAPIAPASKPRFTEEELQKLPPEMRLKALELMGGSAAPQASSDVKFGNGKINATVFYKCSTATSCVLSSVTKGLPELHITETAIWFNDVGQNQRVGNDFKETLVSYRGIDADGKIQDGPSGVLYAAPLPKGEWLIKRLDKVTPSVIEYSWVVRTADGAERVQFSDEDSSLSHLSLRVPASIVVNGTPLSPSAEFGTASVITGGYSRAFSETRYFTVPLCASKATANRVVGKLMHNTETFDSAAYLAEQTSIIPFDGKVYAFAQGKQKGPIMGAKNVLSMTEVDCEKSDYPEKGIISTTFATIGGPSFFGMTDSYPTLKGLGAFVHIKSPSANVILMTERIKEGSALPGMRLEDKTRITVADAKSFLSRYGIANE